MKTAEVKLKEVPSKDPLAFASGYMRGLAEEPWKPDERKVEVLIPVVGSRELAIECLRALRPKPKRQMLPQAHRQGFELGEKVRDGDEEQPGWHR